MNLFFIAFGFSDAHYSNLWKVAEVIEIFFLLEIIIHFFTSFKDPETFKTVNNMKQIAQNYISHGPFALDFIAFFPYQLLFGNVYADNTEDPQFQVLRNVFLLKMIRIVRVGDG